jgi:hypothetical protein
MKVPQLLLLLLLALGSCKKDKTGTGEDALPAEEAIDTAVTAVKAPENTARLIAEFMTRKEEVTSKVKKLGHDEANALYQAYKSQNDSLIMRLQEAEANILNNYYRYFSNEAGEAVTPPDSIQQKVNMLSKAGLEFWEIGEGYVDIRTKPAFYLDIFKNYVSEDFKMFIGLVAEEDKVLYQADAGLAISFKDVGRRVLHWEDFIAKHPYSRLTPQALELYREYQNGYLLGMDNTPTVDNMTNKPYPENLTEFNAFIKNHPDSYTTPLVKFVMNFTGTKDQLGPAVGNEQDKLIKKLTAATTPDYY